MAQILEGETKILEGYTGVTTEQIDGVSVGRIVLPERSIGCWTPDKTFLRFFNSLNGKAECDASVRRSIVFTLNNNTSNGNVFVAHDRALSAYFTYNPKGEIIVEWGTIDTAGKAKLHTYLNQVIDYRARAAAGMQLSSGHLARVTGTETYLAYLDRLSIGREIAQNEPMARMVNTLHSHCFIPLTSEGFVQIPFF